MAIALALFGFPVALAFLSGAVGMVITRVITVEEMYKSIEWKVVFLLAGLIPLGIAMQKTGTAAYIAENMITFMADKELLIVNTFYRYIIYFLFISDDECRSNCCLNADHN